MIPHSGKVMRQCNRLSTTRMQFITGAIKNEKSCNISTSLNKQTNEESSNTDHDQYQDCIQDNQYVTGHSQSQSQQPYQQPYVQQPSQQHVYTQQYYNPQRYIQPYLQYPQHLQYVQQPLPFLQQYPNHQPQYTHYYSTSAAAAQYIDAPSSSSAVVIKKPVDKQSTVVDEKLRLKLERQRLSEIRKDNNARFKSYLTTLPLLEYPNRYKVECIGNFDEANRKLAQLLKEDKKKVFGLDLEWPPCFIKGHPENKVSLVQICSANRILLIQLSRMRGIPNQLRRFFEDKQMLKSGVNIGADGLKLQRDFGIVTNGLVELRDLAEMAISPRLRLSHLRSLRALTGIFLDRNMAKGSVRISNWSRPDLTPLQIKYAALDAYASYELYVTLETLKDPKKTMLIRNLSDEDTSNNTIGKKSRKKVQQQQSEQQPKEQVKEPQQKQAQQQKYHQHNNRSSPTSTVTIIKKNQQSNKNNNNGKQK